MALAPNVWSTLRRKFRNAGDDAEVRRKHFWKVDIIRKRTVGFTVMKRRYHFLIESTASP